MSLRSQLGILRSRLIYYAKPNNRKRLGQFYAQFIQPGDLCFDIGAHLGNRTDAWLRLGARVVAVEPQPECLKFLQKNFSKDARAHIVPKAVGDKPGELPLHVSELTPTISTLAGERFRSAIADASSFHVQWDKSIRVEITTLDVLIKEFGLPAFCKIDVEDFEVEVLQGLNQAIPCLSFEYFSYLMDRALMCIDRLESLGAYTYNWSFGESQVLESEDWLSAKEMKAILSGFGPEDRSGDIYARLK